MRKPRGKYTREKIEARKARQAERQKHIKAIYDGEVIEELPEPVFPEIFEDIRKTYWELLQLIPDPRSSAKTVYPLHLILHRVVCGVLGGNKYIGVLFPKKRATVEPGNKKLGALPTRKAVYQLLRRIDWLEANAILSPLWERLGYTPDLVVRRVFRSSKDILNEWKDKA